MIGDGNRSGHGFLCHPDLKRFKERGHPSLNKVADLCHFIWTVDRAEQLRLNRNQSQPGAGFSQFFEGVRKVCKFQRVFLFPVGAVRL